MKKELYMALLLGAAVVGNVNAAEEESGASAEETASNLLYGWDFNGSDGDSRRAQVEGATGTATVTINGFPNWPDVKDISGENYALKTAKSANDSAAGVPVVANADGSSIGASTGTGFTIAVNSYNVSANDWQGAWKNIAGFRIGTQDYKLQYGGADANTVHLYRNDDGTLTNILTVQANKTVTTATTNQEWMSLVLSIEDVVAGGDAQATLFMLDSHGTLLDTATGKLGVTGDLTKFVTAADCFGNAANFASQMVYLDNLAVYDVAFDANNAKTLTMYEISKGTLPVTVPEPVSATLSLLALAGLAARRRRK